jgi:hypothetical protein
MEDIDSIIGILDQENPGGFDLDIVSISITPENPGAGELVGISVKIANRGRRRSKETPLNLVIGRNEISRLDIPSIEVDGESTFSLHSQLALPTGINTLKFAIDPEGASSDVHRYNNVLATTIVVGESSNTSSFSWKYEETNWDLTFRIPINDLLGLNRDRRIYTYDQYVDYTTPGDRTVSALADALSFYSSHMEYQSYDEVSFVLAFVQDLPYTSDIESRGDNYPRYPIETLLDGGGDCEDSSALFASIISNPDFFNYGTALIIIDDHMGVGVSGSEGVGGTYFEVPTSPHRFYYCETTGRGYAIGDMPDEYQGGTIKELVEIPST